MLLPSALPCDVRRPSRFTSSRLFSTPPPSDTGYPSGNGLLGTCRALQSVLNGSPPPSPSPNRSKARLSSPLPITSTRRSPRSHKAARPVSPRQTPPPRTAALTPPPPPSAPARSANKRRRVTEDDDSDMELNQDRFTTPKRRRHVPYELPLGLAPTDFYSLYSPPVTESPPSPARRTTFQASPAVNPDTPLPSIEAIEPTPSQDTWSAEDDQNLIKLVLGKFRLPQQEWDECARQMGRSHVGARWQSLVGEGRVGLRRQ